MLDWTVRKRKTLEVTGPALTHPNTTLGRVRRGVFSPQGLGSIHSLLC